MLFGAAHERGEVLGIRAAQRIMNTDDAATALDEAFECGPIGITHEARVALVDHQHRDAFQLLRQRRVQRAVHHGTVLGQQLAPIGKELGIIVLARTMGLQAGAQVDLYTVRVLPWNARWTGSRLSRRLGRAKPPQTDRQQGTAYAENTGIPPGNAHPSPLVPLTPA